MSNILKITTPMVPKNYQAPNMQQPTAHEQFVDISNLNKVIKTSDRSETAKQDVNEFQSKEPISELARMMKNPSLGSSALSNILSDELLLAIANMGDPTFGKEIADIARNIFVNSDQLAAEITDQQKFMSLFKGEIFEYMRAILDAAPYSPEVKSAVGNFLRSIVYQANMDEMLRAVANNLDELAKQVSPIKEISTALKDLANSLRHANASQEFGTIRTEIVSIFSKLGDSVLADSRVQRLMSLTVYNISKFNAGDNLIDASFNALLEIFTDEGFKDNLREVLNAHLRANGMLETVTPQPFEAVVSAAEGEIAQEKPPQEAPAQPAPTENQAATTLAPELSADIELAAALSKLMTQEDATKLALELTEFPKEEEAQANVTTNVPAKEDAQVTKSILNLLDMFKHTLKEPLLRSMTENDITNLMRSLLLSPSNATPLMHFVLPIRHDNMRAFGELWVNPDPEKGDTQRDERNAVHMLLCCDVPNIGFFEIELYQKRTSLQIQLFCPNEYVKEFSSIKDEVVKVASLVGFSVKGMNVAPLGKRRTLLDVFPAIFETKHTMNFVI